MASASEDSGVVDARARRKADTEAVFAYPQEQLQLLQEHVREGFARLDGGQIDSFDSIM